MCVYTGLKRKGKHPKCKKTINLVNLQEVSIVEPDRFELKCEW